MENKNYYLQIFGENVTRILRERGLTKKQLAQMTGYCESAVRKWLDGKSQPGMKALIALSKALKTSVNKLIGI